MKPDQLLEMIQEVYPGYHPILKIADIAMDEDVSASVRLKANMTILPYIESQTKTLVLTDVDPDQGVLRLIVESVTKELPAPEIINIDQIKDKYGSKVASETERSSDSYK